MFQGKDSQIFGLRCKVSELEQTVAKEQQTRMEGQLHFEQNQQQYSQEKNNLLEQLVDLRQKLEVERAKHHSTKQEEQKNREKLKKEHEQQIETAVLQEYRQQIINVTEEARTQHELNRQQIEQLEHCDQQSRQQSINLAEEARALVEMNRQQREQCQQREQLHRQQIQHIQHMERVARENCAQHQLPESRSWSIQREQVVISDKVLGEGSWGKVCEGQFRGSHVAVKQLHNVILSAHNRRLFKREMEMASRCRHPNLLQFIGATSDDGSILFVTELLDCDIRHLITEHELTAREIVSLALDVAKGLNYLHCNHPPIVHRDIKLDNVLIWRQGDTWRAKLSDFGAANFVREVMTPNPGAPIYSAPEARTDQHSQPVDVYSFGLLVLEMIINELPVPDQIEQQLERISSAELRNLIRACIRQDPRRRPRMEDVINILTELNL
ncbi:hypothetical protein OS493_034192 [Desmophyllum pertusum]|uniref:Protein kinase domain-containing protein n=1 Tax=Desmophyllum pertusum TaxID=174260 RepID=A0A9X0D0T5_9CNID|nr:hypothetical protein OS493_034192 [Desmophyllum pertusum]